MDGKEIRGKESEQYPDCREAGSQAISYDALQRTHTVQGQHRQSRYLTPTRVPSAVLGPMTPTLT